MSLKIVHFNVGGTKYDVSRSLIETYPGTMLARMISDEWEQDTSKEIFIDRDGGRFRYVLDYMRDQRAYLAMQVSKVSVLKELEYFGFVDVPEDAINAGYAVVEAVRHIHEIKYSYEVDEKAKSDELICKRLAFAMFDHFHQTRWLSKTFNKKEMDEEEAAMCRRFRDLKPLFDKELAQYGLCSTCVDSTKGEYTLRCTTVSL